MHIDSVIKARASGFATAMRNAAELATKEAEIRIVCEQQLALIQADAGIKLEAKHEFTVASGFVDSVYDRVLIEYKNPSTSARIGASLASAGSQKLVAQIQSRFGDIEAEHGHQLTSLLGVGCDGRHFIFVRWRDGDWSVQDPVPVTPHTCERFLRALFNLGTKGKAFTPAQLAEDFGSSSPTARQAIQSLYNAISATKDPKVQVLFHEWRIHFSEICGHNVDKPTDKIVSLAEQYGIDSKALKAPQLLFSLHTYFAFFIKLLAAELVSSVHQLPGGTPLRKMAQAPSSAKLKRELEDLEDGSIFRHFNITNFLEGDLFSWYLSSWSAESETWIRAMVSKLESYNPGSLAEDPTESRDLLKKLYHRLFSRSLRHDLGEYYTPDWLADRTLDGLAYEGDPRLRVLDPACGSGTFLVLTIARIRSWYDANREDCGFNEDDLARLILQNVVGFDLNPLAVMAARTNYLISIRDILGAVDAVELPIYLCDSIMTPSEHGGLFAGSLETARELNTAAGKLLIPTEVAKRHSDINHYAEILESGVRLDYSPAEFVDRCKEEGLPISEIKLHKQLFKSLRDLHEQKRNGIWARIIKNAFAPLFIPKVDYVVGNPPWINWESLPEEYRKSTFDLWKRYGLFRHTGYKAKLGGAKDDISILMTYVCHDVFLKDTGKLGFVITQSVFKTKGGGEGFRGFRYEDGASLSHFSPLAVEDLSALQPFEGAANRTAIMYAGKSRKPVSYPVPYTRWKKKKGKGVNQDDSLAKVLTKVKTLDLLARPVSQAEIRSPWLSGSKATLEVIKQVSGQGSYISRKGVYCPTNAVYWLTERQPGAGNTVIITNLADSGKRKVQQVTAAVEKKFVHDLVRGRDVSRWAWTSKLGIILPQNPGHPSKALPVATMKKSYPKTYAFLREFESDIRSCALLSQFFDPNVDPFYSSYNVGEYTFAPYRVVWKEICSEIEAVVITDDDVIPDHKLVMVSFDEEEPAYFLAGVLNSAVIGLFVRSYAVSTSISGHIFDYAAIPRYSPKNTLHRKIAVAAKACHSADGETLAGLEKKLDGLVGELLGLSLAHVKVAEDELEKLRG
jgi:SAM-dependent methyltransferase